MGGNTNTFVLLRAWGRGEIHRRPKPDPQDGAFGRSAFNGNFKDAARARRWKFWELLLQDSSAIPDWPESAVIAADLGIHALDLDSVMLNLPAPSYLRVPPPGANARRRRQYAKANMAWGMDRFRRLRAVARFVTQHSCWTAEYEEPVQASA